MHQESRNFPRPSSDPSNRRTFERHGMDRQAHLTELDEFGNPGTTWKVRVVDLSRGGVGIRSRRMVHMGRSVLVEFDCEPGRRRLLFGVVKHSRYAEGEGYALGVQLKAVPSTSAVQHWMLARGLAA
jgi:hypothetical protein